MITAKVAKFISGKLSFVDRTIIEYARAGFSSCNVHIGKKNAGEITTLRQRGFVVTPIPDHTDAYTVSWE